MLAAVQVLFISHSMGACCQALHSQVNTAFFLMATKIQSRWLLWHCQRIITKSAANSQNFVMMLD